MTLSQLSAEDKKALTGVHAFSENDCVFVFSEGQVCRLDISFEKHEFLQLFGKLGLEFHVNQQLFDTLEKFVCFLDSFPKKLTVNDVHKSIF